MTNRKCESFFCITFVIYGMYMYLPKWVLKKTRKLKIEKIRRFEIWNRIKSQPSKAEDNYMVNHACIIIVLYPERISADLLSHTYYRDDERSLF